MTIDNIKQDLMSMFEDHNEITIDQDNQDPRKAIITTKGLETMVLAILRIKKHNGLTAETVDGEYPTAEDDEVKIVVSSVASWQWMATTDLAATTTADIVRITGLDYSTVRGQCLAWRRAGKIVGILEYGKHGAIRYDSEMIRRLSATVPGPGNRTTGKSRVEAARAAYATRRARAAMTRPESVVD